MAGRPGWGSFQAPTRGCGQASVLATWGLSTELLAFLRAHEPVRTGGQPQPFYTRSRSPRCSLGSGARPWPGRGIGRHAGACAQGRRIGSYVGGFPGGAVDQSAGHHQARPVRPQFPEPSAGTLSSGASGVHGEGGSVTGAPWTRASWLGTASLGSPRHQPGASDGHGRWFSLLRDVTSRAETSSPTHPGEPSWAPLPPSICAALAPPAPDPVRAAPALWPPKKGVSCPLLAPSRTARRRGSLGCRWNKRRL